MPGCLLEVEAGLDPSDVAARLLAAIRDDEPHAFTHPEVRAEMEEPLAALSAAMDKAASR